MRKIAFAVLAASVIGCAGAEKKVQQTEETENQVSKEISDKEKNKDEKKAQEKQMAVQEEIKTVVDKFAPVEIGVEVDKLDENLKPVIKKLVEAAEIIDRLYFSQVSSENAELREKLAADPSQKHALTLFDIMYGPWNRLDHNKPFVGVKDKPKGANFYPEDLTQEALEKWIADSPDLKEAITGYFTVIRRDEKGELKAIPYSEAYKEYLEPAAVLLDEAAGLAQDKRLKKFLSSRAESFRSNEYRDSDMDWMDLGDGDLEVVIGPYEVYEDELMGYKAAFEAFITLRSEEESRKLDKIKKLIPKMQSYLPIPKKYKKSKRGSDLPISVVDVMYTAGDTRAGVQTLAFNLPNDEVVREKKGFKMVLLKNIFNAKYNKILVPIGERLVREDQVDNISFDAFFNHTLLHETAHGLGPGRIKVEKDGKKAETTVNAELKDLYSSIEETKADILGAYLNYLLVEKGFQKEEDLENVYASLLAGFFRAMRFGTNEAHGKANLIQFNWLKEKGAIAFENGRYAYVPENMKEAIKTLTEEVLMIQALGDYGRAEKLINDYGQMPSDLLNTLRLIEEVPTDLNPSFKIVKQMSDW